MNPTPNQAPESSHRVTRQETARTDAVGAAALRRERRPRGEPPRTAVDRRWRFTDAVAAARQLGAGDAAAG